MLQICQGLHYFQALSTTTTAATTTTARTQEKDEEEESSDGHGDCDECSQTGCHYFQQDPRIELRLRAEQASTICKLGTKGFI